MKKNFKTSKTKQQPRKDSDTKRVNFDNTRVSRFKRDMSESKEQKEDPKGVKGKKGKSAISNDISWYSHNPQMLKSSASLPFSNTVGMSLPWECKYTFPGVMGIHYDISLGGYDSHAIMEAANSTYSYVVHANSRNQSYDANDLMMIILAGNEIFRAIAHAIRAYGVAKTFSQENRYLPEALLKVMGFDPVDIRNNLAQMWFDINRLIAMSTQLWIPNTFPFITRQFWMNSHVYMDGNSKKAQLYLYVPGTFYQYDPTINENGGGLKFIEPWAKNVEGNTLNWTWSKFNTMITDMFSALLDDQDRGIIFGDILKAYGPDKLYTVSEITADYTVTPVYDSEVLTQINNVVIFRNLGGDIVQHNTGQQGSAPIITKKYNYRTYDSGNANEINVPNGTASVPLRPILNFMDKEDPTPEDIMIATRMMVAKYTYSLVGTDHIVWPMHTGTEVANSICVAAFGNGSEGKSLNTIYVDVYTPALTGANVGRTVSSQFAAFDWCPYIYLANAMPTPSANDAGGFSVYNVVGDIENYTFVDDELLRKLHATDRKSVV